MTRSLQILLRDAHAAITAEVSAALARAGYSEIHPGHHVVLRNLGENGARPSEMAVAAGVTRQAITKVVVDLERRGVVRRQPDPDDGRGIIVRYTDRGLEGLALARRTIEAMEADFAARIGADRWADVRTALETLFADHPGPREVELLPSLQPAGRFPGERAVVGDGVPGSCTPVSSANAPRMRAS